jgi:hypothetical protein
LQEAPDADKIRRMVKDYLQSVDIRIWEAPYTYVHALVAVIIVHVLGFC